MQELNFRMPGASHWGYFTHTEGWKELCYGITGQKYVAQFKEKPFDFFTQKLIIQSLLLENKPFKEKKFVEKTLYDLLDNPKISLMILKYFFESKDIDYFRFSVIKTTMTTIVKKNPAILDALHREANSFALHKKLDADIENNMVKNTIKI